MNKKIAAFDFGLSGDPKVVWPNKGGQLQFERVYQSGRTLSDMLAVLKADGVNWLNVIGSGQVPELPGFDQFADPEPGDRITEECCSNIYGATKGCGPEVARKLSMLVSLGTGFSWRLMRHGGHEAAFLGDPSGGASFRFKVSQNPDVLKCVQSPTLGGRSLTITMGEINQRMRGGSTAMHPAAYFAKATPGSSSEDIAYTYLEELVGQLILGTMLRIQIAGTSVRDVVFIGGMLTHYPALRMFLEQGCASVGLKAHFPDRPEFAGAYGAWCLSNEWHNS